MNLVAAIQEEMQKLGPSYLKDKQKEVAETFLRRNNIVEEPCLLADCCKTPTMSIVWQCVFPVFFSFGHSSGPILLISVIEQATTFYNSLGQRDLPMHACMLSIHAH